MNYVVYRDRTGQWRWRLMAANHKVIADSGESYLSKTSCYEGIRLVKSSGFAPVYER